MNRVNDDACEKLRQTLARYHQTYVSAVENEFGQHGVEVLKKAFKELGRKSGEDLLRESVVKEKGLKGFLRYLSELTTITGFKFEIIEPSERKKILRVHHCPYEIVWRKMQASKKVCEVLTQIDEGMAEAFCGRQIHLELASSVFEGTPYCDYVFELK